MYGFFNKNTYLCGAKSLFFAGFQYKWVRKQVQMAYYESLKIISKAQIYGHSAG
jgi:hypothetical protein